MAATDSANKAKGKAVPDRDEIIQRFQTLRTEQRQLALKLSELEQELQEHRLVLETLKTADPARRCFRLVSGVLCELTVAEVMPIVQNNSEQLTRLIANLNDALINKGKELVEHKERYNIRIRGGPEEKVSESERTAASGKEPSSVLVDGATQSVG